MPELPPRRGFWKRFVLGALLVVLATASATAFAAFREVDEVVEALRLGTDLELGGELAEAEAGQPQTLMLIGSDKRAKGAADAAAGARSDTVILVRVDPARGATALMSLPRDLKVKIPGHGTDKLNAAYSIGGPRLTLRTVKELTGLRINHVINVDFGGFREAVSAIGCVYVDIDRRYYNDNTGGGERYATIDVKQGYQKLCGPSALDYVRYRHEDSDIVRSARQQDFLRQAKDQNGVGDLFGDREKLVDIFGRYTESDIRSRGAVLRLIKVVVASIGAPIREVHFEGKVGPSFVTASSRTVRKLTQEFLGVEDTKGPRGGSGKPSRRRRKAPAGGVEEAPDAGREQAVQAAGLGSRFAVFYPTRRAPGSVFTGEPRVYAIRGSDGVTYNSYRMVLSRGAAVREYYGVQGTTWKDPPILRQPSEKRMLDGREFELHFDGDRLRLVAWRTPEAVYWISNTLLQSLSERQMLAIARSTKSL